MNSEVKRYRFCANHHNVNALSITLIPEKQNPLIMRSNQADIRFGLFSSVFSLDRKWLLT